MRFLPTLLVLVLFVPTLVHPASVLAEDGIPNNCNYPYGAYYRSQVFPRYESQIGVWCWSIGRPAREGTRGGCAHIRYNSGCGMGVSGAWVFVYGDESLSTWNMDTLAHASVPVVTPGRQMLGALIGPDGRYLVVSRAAVRVWDLANLPADFAARTPIANYDVGADDVLSVRFIDNTTFEVVTRTLDGTATTRYDVATGKRL